MGEWTPERDAALVAHFGLDVPESIQPEDVIRIAIRDLRAAWLRAEALLVQACSDVDGLVARAEASRDHARTEMARLGGSLELALTDTERERDAALARVTELEAEVARLRALLAEPSEEEADRLADILYHACSEVDTGNTYEINIVGVRALLADLRARAGGADV